MTIDEMLQARYARENQAREAYNADPPKDAIDPYLSPFETKELYVSWLLNKKGVQEKKDIDAFLATLLVEELTR